MRPLAARVGAGAAMLLWLAGPAAASPESEALRARASKELYNLDQEAAVSLFREAVAADPSDAGAHRGLASGLWLGITFGRGTMTVDSYLGRITQQDVKLPPPPADAAAEFQRALEQATSLARGELTRSPRDADALYQLGAAAGLRASYVATVTGSFRGAFGAAREAYKSHARALELNPARRDAGLIVGMYSYFVAAMSLPIRMVARVAGISGGREKGLALIEQAAAYAGDNRADARLALVLLYNREQKYDLALKHLEDLRADYPRNRLLWLESGATALRAGRAADAERFLNDGIAKLDADTRRRMLGEEALWFLKRGTARVALGQFPDAQRDLEKSTSLPARDWVRARTRLELGKIHLKKGDRAGATVELRTAIALAEKDRDEGTADEARRLLK